MASEFGSGIVVCLAKFSEHLGMQRYRNSVDLELWMNGASDHFYDLDRQRAPKSLIQLADLTLEIGHGFTGKNYTEKDYQQILKLWKKSCIAIDKKLNTNPDWGRW